MQILTCLTFVTVYSESREQHPFETILDHVVEALQARFPEALDNEAVQGSVRAGLVFLGTHVLLSDTSAKMSIQVNIEAITFPEGLPFVEGRKATGRARPTATEFMSVRDAMD